MLHSNIMKLHLLFLPIALLCFSFGLTAQSTAISDCGLFADGPNDTWPYALTVTTPDSGNSSAEQVIDINVTMLPAGGANYRVVKTVSNGNWNNGNAFALTMGLNTITVSAVKVDKEKPLDKECTFAPKVDQPDKYKHVKAHYNFKDPNLAASSFPAFEALGVPPSLALDSAAIAAAAPRWQGRRALAFQQGNVKASRKQLQPAVEAFCRQLLGGR